MSEEILDADLYILVMTIWTFVTDTFEVFVGYEPQWSLKDPLTPVVPLVEDLGLVDVDLVLLYVVPPPPGPPVESTGDNEIIDLTSDTESRGRQNVTMPANPKDAPRSLKAHNAGETQQTKGARKLSEEIKQLKQDLQVQIVCCEHEMDEVVLQENQVKHLTNEVTEVRHQLQLKIENSSDCWAQGFIDDFNSLKTALSASAWYPDLDYSDISVKQLSTAFNQLASQRGTPTLEMSFPIFNSTDALINQEASPSLEIIEKDRGSLKANLEGVGENAPDPTLSPFSLPEVTGPKDPFVTLRDTLLPPS
ncbi:hypothetical protein CJ030_MR4G001653 [Morella rubra]|uniref:Uncharacterized protein n=1 Tax=Morella rubra TaxID=262757 RepID=A0A6A1VS12_9ROSI|nr:hypothetical protein CJ030_MR4G001653 [Morella rubra]